MIRTAIGQSGYFIATSAVMFLFILSGCTTSPQYVVTDKSLFSEKQFSKSFIFPDEICGCMKKEVLNFEEREPGLGYTIRYGAVDTELSFHVYDAGFINIPNGINQPPVPEAFFESVQHIRYYSEKGVYQDIQIVDENIEVVLNQHPFLMSKVKFMVNGQNKVSYLLVTGIQNKILKIRATIDDGQDNYGETVFNFIIKDIEENVIGPIMVPKRI